MYLRATVSQLVSFVVLLQHLSYGDDHLSLNLVDKKNDIVALRSELNYLTEFLKMKCFWNSPFFTELRYSKKLLLKLQQTFTNSWNIFPNFDLSLIKTEHEKIIWVVLKVFFFSLLTQKTKSVGSIPKGNNR